MLDPALRARRYLTANAARKAKFSNGRSQSKPANESSEVAVVYPAPLSEVSSCRLAVGHEAEGLDRLVEVDVIVDPEEGADRRVVSLGHDRCLSCASAARAPGRLPHAVNHDRSGASAP